MGCLDREDIREELNSRPDACKTAFQVEKNIKDTSAKVLGNEGTGQRTNTIRCRLQIARDRQRRTCTNDIQ